MTKEEEAAALSVPVIRAPHLERESHITRELCSAPHGARHRSFQASGLLED